MGNYRSYLWTSFDLELYMASLLYFSKVLYSVFTLIVVSTEWLLCCSVLIIELNRNIFVCSLDFYSGLLIVIDIIIFSVWPWTQCMFESLQIVTETWAFHLVQYFDSYFFAVSLSILVFYFIEMRDTRISVYKCV